MNNLFDNKELRGEVLFVLAALTIMMSQGILTLDLWSDPRFAIIRSIRLFHIFICAFITLLILFKSRPLNLTQKRVYFLALISPVYATLWFNQVQQAQLTSPWVPFKGVYGFIMGLIIFVPAGYLINAIILFLFAIEVMILWFYLDLWNSGLVIKTGEPFFLISTFTIALMLLYMRYRDEKALENYAKESERQQYTKNLARVLISIRDLTNTPLQVLVLLSNHLKNHSMEHTVIAEKMEKSLDVIMKSNKKFNRLEKYLDWEQDPLMTEKEVDHWFDEIEHEKNSKKNG